MNKDNMQKGNMQKGFDNEAISHTKMKLYGEKAKEDGFAAIGDTFEDISKSDLAISRVWLENEGGLGTIEENLQSGIEVTQENIEFYDSLIENDDNPLFLAIKQVKEENLDTLQEALDSLDAETIYTPGKSSTWRCTRCGFVATGRHCPLRCPLCGCGQGYFRPYTPRRRRTPPPPRPGRPRYPGRR